MKFSTQTPYKTLHLVSLGCTKNLVDSEVMLGKLNTYKLTNDASSADVIIVNTCGFIDSAKQESINTVLELHEQRKEESVLVMAGCLSERYKQELQQDLIEVDVFTGVGDYDRIDELVSLKQSHFTSSVFLQTEVNERLITGSNYHAYVKLSEGCNQTCSFCAIPSFKGKLFSRTLESLVKEVKALVAKGFFDFSFVSQDSSSYLRDHGINDGLEQLIAHIETIQGVKSARILYLYPSTTTHQLIDAIASSNVFHNYFDMPLQHISASLLKTMKRGKKVEQLKTLMQYMKQQDNAFVRTTFIVGHPGETQEDFNELCDYVRDFGFDRANVFAYSNEEGTLAFEMSEQINESLIEERLDILGEIIEQSTQQSLQNEIGKTVDVVIDKQSEEHEYLLSARKLMWAPDIDGEIYINDNELEQTLEFGVMYKAKITELAGDKLLATVVQKA